MKQKRQSGILLHPTSLPGNYGIGDLGPEAYKFLDFMEAAGQSLWQVLPLGPTGYGDSPYASFSTFAGNPLLISIDELRKEGDIEDSDLKAVPDFPKEKVDYGWVVHWKVPLLKRAAARFLTQATPVRKKAYDLFVQEEGNWLPDYGLFMAVKDYFQKKADEQGVMGKMWSNFWDRDIRLKEPKAVKVWSAKLADEIEIHKVLQFFFYRQWLALRQYANEKGIRIVGDIPIFVAPDSVDVWANRSYFKLDEEGQATVVAGVPPDYFSATGQLWGNPLFNWEAMKKDRFKWWIKRIQATLKLVDIIRIDHFRGFEAYWEIPAGEPTAVNGEWVKAPGMELFAEVKKQLGELPILAEDLGVITPEVEHMRDFYEFPGMKILQFAFDSGEAGANMENPFLPHNYIPNCVVYTGSHDNDTVRGWFESAKPEDQELARKYLSYSQSDISWGFIRAAVSSVARLSILPLQDLMNQPSSARMNKPSTLGGNWDWRFQHGDLSPSLSKRFLELCRLYGRAAEKIGT